MLDGDVMHTAARSGFPIGKAKKVTNLAKRKPKIACTTDEA